MRFAEMTAPEIRALSHENTLILAPIAACEQHSRHLPVFTDSILVGAVTSITMILLSKTVWVDVLHFQTAIFPMKNPAIFSMAAAFAVGILVSLASPEKEAQEKFEGEKIRTYLGVGAE